MKMIGSCLLAPASSRCSSSPLWPGKRQSAVLFELKAATDLAELLLRKRRIPEAYRHISAALNGTPDEMMSPVHMRARQVLRRFQFSAEVVG